MMMQASKLGVPLLAAIALTLAAPPAAGAAAAPANRANATEAPFISKLTASLMARYPTTNAAVKGGYFQLTPLDQDNTAIYFNGTYTNVDPMHPNFLWYDRHGKLVGLDYEYAMSKWPKIPTTSEYPVLAARWTVIRAHMHFAYRMGSGPMVMHGAHLRPNITRNPVTAAQLQADHLLPAGAKLQWADYHPKCWDLGFWLVSNPLGAFAEKNPLVK